MTNSKAHIGPKKEKAVYEVLSYFHFFEYPPTNKDIYKYMRRKISQSSLHTLLSSLEEKGKIAKIKYGNELKYTLQGHSISPEKVAKKARNAQKKIQSTENFVHILSMFPWVSLVGVSGSCAMQNAQDDDDIDIFVISQSGALWLSRLTAVLVAKILGRHRYRGMKKVRDKMCLNLFFDTHELTIPKHKQNIYTAHEVCQMKPLLNKYCTHEAYMYANRWVLQYLPNISIQHTPQHKPSMASIWKPILFVLEPIAKAFQLKIMKKPTKEIISDHQLWFFPKDFEDTIRRKIAI